MAFALDRRKPPTKKVLRNIVKYTNSSPKDYQDTLKVFFYSPLIGDLHNMIVNIRKDNSVAALYSNPLVEKMQALVKSDYVIDENRPPAKVSNDNFLKISLFVMPEFLNSRKKESQSIVQNTRKNKQTGRDDSDFEIICVVNLLLRNLLLQSFLDTNNRNTVHNSEDKLPTNFILWFNIYKERFRIMSILQTSSSKLVHRKFEERKEDGSDVPLLLANLRPPKIPLDWQILRGHPLLATLYEAPTVTQILYELSFFYLPIFCLALACGILPPLFLCANNLVRNVLIMEECKTIDKIFKDHEENNFFIDDESGAQIPLSNMSRDIHEKLLEIRKEYNQEIQKYIEFDTLTKEVKEDSKEDDIIQPFKDSLKNTHYPTLSNILKSHTTQYIKLKQAIAVSQEAGVVDRFQDNFLVSVTGSENIVTLFSTHRDELADLPSHDIKNITKYVTKFKKKPDSEDKSTCDPPLPGKVPEITVYQKIVKSILRPRGPRKRLLVNHRVGSGKTLTMSGVLENYVNDPRPKLLLFPTDALRTQFLLSFVKNNPNSALTTMLKNIGDQEDYQSHLFKMCTNIEDGTSPFLLSKFGSAESHSEHMMYVQSERSKKGNWKLVAPIMALTFEQLTYMFDYMRQGQLSKFIAFFMWGKVESHEVWQKKHQPAYITDFLDNIVMLVDEVHLLFKSDVPSTLVAYNEITDQMSKVKHCVIGGFTATVPYGMWRKLGSVFDEEYSLGRGQSKNGVVEHPEMLRNCLHYYDGLSDTKFRFFGYKEPHVVEVTVNEKNKRLRNDFRKENGVLDGISGSSTNGQPYENRKVITRPQYKDHFLTDEYITLKNLSDDVDDIPKLLAGLQIYIPLVHKLLLDIMMDLGKDVVRGGIIIIANRNSGLWIIKEMLDTYIRKKLAKTFNGYLFITGKASALHGFSSKEPEKEINSKGVADSVVEWNKEKHKHNIHSGDDQPRILLIDSNAVKEGLDISHIERVYSVSNHVSFTQMRQLFARGDRRCSPQSLYSQSTKHTGKTEYQHVRQYVIDGTDADSKMAREQLDVIMKQYSVELTMNNTLRMLSVDQDDELDFLTKTTKKNHKPRNVS